MYITVDMSDTYIFLVLLICFPYNDLLFQSRSAMIPGIVTFLQKIWRGYLAREYYKRLRSVYRIMGAYRKHKLR